MLSGASNYLLEHFHLISNKYLHASLFLLRYQVVKVSTDGLGTNEDSLSRAIVTRAEIDMIK